MLPTWLLAGLLGLLLGVLLAVGTGFGLGVIVVHHGVTNAGTNQIVRSAPAGKDLVEPEANLNGPYISAPPGKDLVEPTANLGGSTENESFQPDSGNP